VLGDGNEAVIEALRESGNLLSVDPYLHKYPYDWRTKKPTIFRATDQWFASVDNFRDDAMAAIDSVKWMPDFGKNRISAMTSSRSDWCISRQRTWGVPIPVFYHKETGEALMTEETIGHITALVREKGSDAWFELGEADLLPPSLAGEVHQWQKGTDTMDVWFDSGSSWSGVVNARPSLSFPADLYLEGSDQHRGWFQSSLLTAVASEGVAPYKNVLTHGFVLDEKGIKMSKSIGNVVDPKQVIEGGNNKKKNPAYGADVLRLWVASVDYTTDVCIGDNIIKQVFESYRRIRNTARYLIGNLADFNPETDSVAYEDMSSLDKYILGRYSEVVVEVTDAFEQYQFFRASQAILKFASADLSSFYLDIAKDRLYIGEKDSARRRSCQTVFKTIVEGMSKMMAPILPHMAEDIWVNLPYTPASGAQSVFQDGWVAESYPAHREEDWALILKLRGDVNKAIEAARSGKLVGSSLDCAVTVYARDEATRALLDQLAIYERPGDAVDDLRYLTLTSDVRLVDSEAEATAGCGKSTVLAAASESGCTIGVEKASAQKCERCWMYTDDVGCAELPSVCIRCSDAVNAWKNRQDKMSK
jgi:isoleucyl-tRNA synthetase